MIRQVHYFEKAGKGHTETCIDAAKQVLAEQKKRYLVVASTTGETARKVFDAVQDIEDLKLVVVTHSAGFKELNQIDFPQELREEITAAGHHVLTTTILTHSLETSLATKFGGVMPTHIIAHSLRRFGEGTKVCCEIVMEACDAGLIPEKAEVLAMAGTGHGADTVLLVQSVASKRFLELKVLEILAKPR